MITPTRPSTARPRALYLALTVVGLGLTAACVGGGGQPPVTTLPPVGPSTTTTAPTTSTSEATTTTSAPTTSTSTSGPTTTTAPTTSTSEATTTTTEATTTTTAPSTTTTGLPPSSEPRVAFVSPAEGATVTSPVTIRMVAENFEIEAAGLARPGAGHFHLLVDTPCLAEGREIPRDATHIHLGNGQMETSIDLPAGPHTLCLQAGDGIHRALPLTDSRSIVVAPTS